jgi:hypothetical protein
MFKFLLRILGYIWSLPLTVFGLLLLCTVYWPRSVTWRNGALEVVVRWHLIPRGMDRTGDGDLDDPEDFLTGGQTHGAVIFLCDENQRNDMRLHHHERHHVVQAMILGFILYPLGYGVSCLIGLCKGKGIAGASQDCWFERWARAMENQLPWLFR